jgi:ubiquinone/menaquinone biosynthesis C-methylase UbiE
MKLDLGCGQIKRPGFIGMDISPNVGAEIVHDWDVYPWPFEDDSVEELNAGNVLEHVTDLMKFMNECYRIMKTGAQFHVVCPYYTSIKAFQDPTHVRAISEMTFYYFDKQKRDNWGLSHYPITADFTYSYIFHLEDNWQNKPEAETWFALKHYFNVAGFIAVELIKR